MVTKKFFLPEHLSHKPRAAIFLSGSGSNAERLLESWRRAGETALFMPAVLITDAPRTSRARELAAAYDLPLVEHDIREFYRRHGEDRFSLATARGREIREEWTEELRERLSEFTIDFGVLAGFRPLTNITGDFPCLNVHPGDLTYLKEGRRWLVGLHTVPVERAILEGLDTLRSSVIVAQPYNGGGGDMDSGPILGISEPVMIDFQGHSREGLAECYQRRPGKRPKGGFGDNLQSVAEYNLERLKVHGDWIVLPGVVFDFAAGRFALDEDEGLLFRLNQRMHSVQTVVYSENGRELVFSSE